MIACCSVSQRFVRQLEESFEIKVLLLYLSFFKLEYLLC